MKGREKDDALGGCAVRRILASRYRTAYEGAKVICAKCGVDKDPEDGFYSRDRTCKTCRNKKRVQAIREANPEWDDGPTLADVKRQELALAEQRKRDFAALTANTERAKHGG